MPQSVTSIERVANALARRRPIDRVPYKLSLWPETIEKYKEEQRWIDKLQRDGLVIVA